jgi:hypothetical protein
VLALVSVIDPARFHWHRNWKAGAIHPSFPLTIPSIDHAIHSRTAVEMT